MEIKEIQEIIKAQNIDTIRIEYPDLHGICRNKMVPAKRLEELAAHPSQGRPIGLLVAWLWHREMHTQLEHLHGHVDVTYEERLEARRWAEAQPDLREAAQPSSNDG